MRESARLYGRRSDRWRDRRRSLGNAHPHSRRRGDAEFSTLAAGGGGGAGGVLSGSATLGTATFAVVVGAGGAAMTTKTDPIKGSNTTFNSLTALGGGGGQAEDRAAHANQDGGSGGGGCGNYASPGGDGTSTLSAGGDLTLQSLDTTALVEPDYADMVMLMEDTEGTATLNTDIKGYISEDSGSTFTQGTLVNEGSWGTNKKILAFHDLDISAQSGTSMCYKVTTHNQSEGSKETKVHAVSIGWKE